jgi:glyoxylase-like metal-dependent hydrolase (beta-lactamase superfamily II)
VRCERFEAALWRTTSLALLDGGRAVVVDPCISADECARIAAWIDGAGARVTDVLVTHGDWDHVCGIAAFPHATATMSEATAARVRDPDGAIAELREAEAEYGVRLAGPPRVDRVFAAGETIAAGRFTIETSPLRGHTHDGVAYRVRELDVLVVGDHLSPVEFPFAASTAEYRRTLAGLVDTLRSDPPRVVFPGHGGPLTAAEAVAIAEADLAYLDALREAVAAGGREGGRAVEPPRAAAGEPAREREANVDAQLAELAG